MYTNATFKNFDLYSTQYKATSHLQANAEPENTHKKTHVTLHLAAVTK